MPKLQQILEQLRNLAPDQVAHIRRRERGIYHVTIEDKLEILGFVGLKIATQDRRYGIIHVPKDVKDFFPGYRRQFVLHTDVKPFVMHLTGASNAQRGDIDGGYLCHPKTSTIDDTLLPEAPDARTNNGSFQRFYEAHPELQPGDFLTISKIDDTHYHLRA